ncbi:MAG: hypothetical protein WCO25_01895 [Candidatus Uhrbacteria bacterium]
MENLGRSGLDSYTKGENPTQQTALRIMALDNQIAGILLGKPLLGLSETELVKIDQAKSEMTSADRLRFPNMSKAELAELARNLAIRFDETHPSNH